MKYRSYTSPWRPVTARNVRIPAANRGRYPLRTTEWRPSAVAPKAQRIGASSMSGTASRTRLSPEAERPALAELERTTPTIG
jgi:hypothetical protein